jgi:hypothetical protein
MAVGSCSSSSSSSYQQYLQQLQPQLQSGQVTPQRHHKQDGDVASTAQSGQTNGASGTGSSVGPSASGQNGKTASLLNLLV